MRLIQPGDLALATEALEAGELVVVPTHRWYMVCANAADDSACDQIFTNKRRPSSKSLVYVQPTVDSVSDQFVLTAQARRLVSMFWPGDLALLLPWRDIQVGAKHRAVGVPNALVTCAPGVLGELAKRARVPVAATTVNVSGAAGTGGLGPAITTAEVKRFIDTSGIQITYVIDGGVCPLANHLTIVDCTTQEGNLIRPGAVHERAIAVAMEQADGS